MREVCNRPLGFLSIADGIWMENVPCVGIGIYHVAYKVNEAGRGKEFKRLPEFGPAWIFVFDGAVELFDHFAFACQVRSYEKCGTPCLGCDLVKSPNDINPALADFAPPVHSTEFLPVHAAVSSKTLRVVEIDEEAQRRRPLGLRDQLDWWRLAGRPVDNGIRKPYPIRAACRFRIIDHCGEVAVSQ